MSPRRGHRPRGLGRLPTAQVAATRTRTHTASPGRPGCHGGRCRVLAAGVALCERHATALLLMGDTP